MSLLVLLGCGYCCSFVLINECDVFIIQHESEPGHKLMYDSFIKVGHNSEFLRVLVISNHFLFDSHKLVIFRVSYFEGELVRIVVWVYKAIVQEKAVVALLAV